SQGASFVFLDRDHQDVVGLGKVTADLYKQSKLLGLSLPPPEAVFFTQDDLARSDARSLWFRSLRDDSTSVVRHKLGGEPPRGFFGNVPFFQEEVDTLLANGYQVFVFAESQSQAQ